MRHSTIPKAAAPLVERRDLASVQGELASVLDSFMADYRAQLQALIDLNRDLQALGRDVPPGVMQEAQRLERELPAILARVEGALRGRRQ